MTIVEETTSPRRQEKGRCRRTRSIGRKGAGDPAFTVEAQHDFGCRLTGADAYGQRIWPVCAPTQFGIVQDSVRRPGELRKVSHELAALECGRAIGAHYGKEPEHTHIELSSAFRQSIARGYHASRASSRPPVELASDRRDCLLRAERHPTRVADLAHPAALLELNHSADLARISAQAQSQVINGGKQSLLQSMIVFKN